MSKHTALYTRVSTEAQAEEGYSIEAQKKLLEAWCVSKEIKNYTFYVDAGYSGSNLERPEIKKLIEKVKAGEIDTVAVYKLDRLSRSQKDTLYLIEDVFNPSNTGFVSLSENMDTSTPIGRAMLGIMSAFAQLERETIRIRTRMGMKERVKSGKWMGGGKTPFGYDYDNESGKLVKNADAETVKKIYSLYLDGYSPSAIAGMLGMKYDRIISQILKRKTNTGIIPYRGEEYKGNHEPIVDNETYYRALEEMKKRSKRIGGGVHLLSGLVFCGLCGARMRYQKWGKKGYKLVCYSTQNSKPYLVRDPDCPSERVWADEIEKHVIDDIFSMTLDKSKSPQSENLEATISQKKKRLEKKLSRLYEIYSEGDDTALEVIKKLKEEMKDTENEIKRLRLANAKKESRKSIIETADNLSEIWPTLTDEERKKTVEKLVEKIVIFPGRIEIHFHE